MNQKTAILIFTRSPKNEARHKILHLNKKINEKLHVALYHKTLNLVKATSLPFFIVDNSEYEGNNFGEKLANAMGGVFMKNYDAVIAIGNDCPQLSTEMLLKASEEIKDHDVVLGPDRNGGVYLIAMKLKVFNAKSIIAVPWRTKKVFAYLLNYENYSENNLSVLPKLSDFNKLSDYYFFKNIISTSRSFIKLITTIISGTAPYNFFKFASIYRFRVLSIKQLRAPPYSC
ncbi:MAG: hypothetical protein NVSMB67_30530 [Flavisolibacter sp.]